MSTTMSEGQSVLKPPNFDGTNFKTWKERMRIYIQSVDFRVWIVIKNGPKIPKKLVDGQEAEKCEEEFNDEDMKDIELEAKAKNILYCAINIPNAFVKLSSCNTAKEIWDMLHRENMTVVVNFTTPQRPPVTTDEPDNSPNLDFLADTREAMDNYLNLCVPLHKYALQGNWAAAKCIIERDRRLKHAALASGWPTVLHVAAGTNHATFVKELLLELEDGHVILQDARGNTAFFFAAVSGNLEIVRLLRDRNRFLPTMRNAHGQTPIHLAAMQGKCEMTWFLYEETVRSFQDNSDWESLFFSCINTRNYRLALKMVRERRELTFARDKNGDSALHLLALIQKPLESCSHCHEHQQPSEGNPGTRKHVIFQLVNFLWSTLFQMKDSKEEIIKFIDEPYQLLFDAAEVGNFGFLSELLSFHPSLIWEVDNKNQSIIHTAVSFRHASIFNVIHEIGPLMDIIVTYPLKDKNTLLHLAAKLAPSSQLELISGAAFQMWLELLWFEEVKKIMPPPYIKLKNSDDQTAEELFTKEHKELREKAEEWMKRTAEFGMLMSTVIATGVFSAAINIPGGIDDQSNMPNYLGKTSFQVFALSDTCAFISSAAAVLIFLSILISRYAERDFYGTLPLKLMFGLITLFISITSMMVAFSSAFFITYYFGSEWIPILSSALATLPILLYLGLQFPLWSDFVFSFCYCWTIFKPSERMIK